MSDVESVRMQLNDVELRRTSQRQTPLTSFGTIMRRGMLTGVNTIKATASSAGYALPGAAVVSAAVGGYGIARDAENPQAGGYLSGASMDGAALGGGMGGNPMEAVSKQAANGDSSAQMMLATRHMQDLNNMFNVQYLQIQQSMQKDSREFTMISNIMKTKHDTARNSLSNLK
jgi:hypothetical protein